jgi:hypothetical protein
VRGLDLNFCKTGMLRGVESSGASIVSLKNLFCEKLGCVSFVQAEWRILSSFLQLTVP